MDPRVSIVIPIYNVSRFLDDCMNSLLKADDVCDMEIFLVDDGSTDDSGIVAEKYSQNYKNIRCFHKPNGGLSDARNFGIAHAKGEYVIFVDSDDCVKPKEFAEILKVVYVFSGDVLIWDASVVDEEGNSIDSDQEKYMTHTGVTPFKNFSGEESIKQQLVNHPWFVVSVCLGAYRRQYLLENNYYFETGILYEDDLWKPIVMLNARKLIYIPIRAYSYRIREGSIIHNVDLRKDKHVESLIYVFNSMYEYYDHNISDILLRKMLESSMTKRYLHAITKLDIFHYKVSRNVPRWKILRSSGDIKDIIRSLILLLNGRLYCAITRKIST